jgi:ATP-binding cassette subfamily F protein 3
MVYGSRLLFDNGELLVRPGDRIGLVGPNGAGKTTVFRLITGIEHPDQGTISIDPGVVVGYFSQDVGEMAGESALAEVMCGAGRVWQIGQELAKLEHQMSDTTLGLSDTEMERYGRLQNEFLELDGYDLESRAETILSGLGIDNNRMHQPLSQFSGGWKMRIALARILLLNPDVLLIDEPTNHLDMESILWLEEWLRGFKGAIVMTCHDRDFMNRLCTRTVEVAMGAITSYSGDYEFYLRERDIRREQLIASHKRQQAMLAKEEEFISRFAARASHAAQVQSRIKAIEKIERIELPKDPRSISFEFKPVKRSGDQVLVLDQLAKSWELDSGQKLPVFSGLSGTVIRGQKIALTGVNGAGKSTLLKIITGQTDPSEGRVSLGAGVEIGYFSQYSSDVLRANRTIFEELSERLPLESVGAIKNLLGAFLFSGDDADKKVSILSGGERSRVMLACLLAIGSREVLLQALTSFEGTILIVSHDRYFLRHLCNRVFQIDHGQLRVYEGSYAEFQARQCENASLT